MKKTRIKKKVTKKLVWRNIFPDPNVICSSEYRAIFEVLVDGVFNGLYPPYDHVLTAEEAKQINWMLRELALNVKALARAMGEPHE